jgi:aryl-alcohol dehydrogenase-like predicted oxidoreductase
LKRFLRGEKTNAYNQGMKYRTLGRTNLRVSEIGFGCGNIGGLMIRAPLEERLKAVSRATELGINYFDTAFAYGQGQSEQNLGEVLALTKLKPIVATKFSLGQQDIPDIKGGVRRSLEASLKRLKRESVDIFQLHTPVAYEGTQRSLALKSILSPGGVADALDELRSEGLIHFAGFTGLGETSALTHLIESRRFDLVQAYYNLLNPSAGKKVRSNFSSQDFGELIRKAALQNMGVVAIRVLAGGALGGAISREGYASPSVGGALVTGSEYAADLRRASKLDFLLKGRPGKLSQVAIRFALDRPGISTVMVGFSNLSQIEEAAACSDLSPLTEAELKLLERQWDSNFEA